MSLSILHFCQFVKLPEKQKTSVRFFFFLFLLSIWTETGKERIALVPPRNYSSETKIVDGNVYLHRRRHPPSLDSGHPRRQPEMREQRVARGKYLWKLNDRHRRRCESSCSGILFLRRRWNWESIAGSAHITPVGSLGDAVKCSTINFRAACEA